MELIECPYCKKDIDIQDYDIEWREQDIFHEIECGNCEKHFVFETFVSYSFQAEKADCLNNSHHSWEKIQGYPVEFSKMECTVCYRRRDLSEEERLEHGIGTKEDYFNSLNKIEK